MSKIRAACVQMDAGSDLEKNLAKAERFFLQAVRLKSDWVAFPENFLWRGKAYGLSLAAERSAKAVFLFRSLAKKHKVSVLLGSILEKTTGKKYFNTSVLIDASGRVAARYRKIHLFDVDIPGARCLESKHVRAGDKIVSARLDRVQTGLAVCYDLRFPELFRALSARGARVLFLPANFTETTGKAHWEILLRARAIENLAFVIAPGQVGTHPENKIKSFGTSLILDPWGKVLAKGTRSKEQVITADLDFSAQLKIRKKFPVLTHIRV